MTFIRVPQSMLPTPAKQFLMQTQYISHTIWKRIKHSGTFHVNGVPVNAAQTVIRGGDCITYDIVRESAITPEEIPLSICYEDPYLLIANKPAGQLVHPTTKESTGTLGNAVLAHFAAHGEHHAYHPVHRLDRATSGLVLIAKVPQVQDKLTARKNGKKLFHREYLAIVSGGISPSTGTIDAPIARALPSIILRKVAAEGKSAITHYETQRAGKNHALLRLALETGRTHQIRVHLAHLGHPILGDSLYGGAMNEIKRQALHAYRLHFTHPMTNELIDIIAPIPSDMKQILSSPDF